MNNPGVTTVTGVPLAWPKGQVGFYMMKYEISQQQYAEFLNTLATGQLSVRLPGNFSLSRNRLQTATTPFSSDRPERAQGYLSSNDIQAYADWACLRPATETEFEKACRGNGSTRGEYAWGNLVIAPATTFSGAEDGSETTTAGNCVYNNTAWTNGDAGRGPARCGIFATATSTRQQAGASYYGIMDLSGNVRETVMNLHSTGTSNTYTRSWGDGALSAAGNHNCATWPLFSIAIGNNSNTNFWGTRGGAYSNGATEVQVSNRNYMRRYNTAVNTKANVNGGRCVR
jgi:formylglycine-generating enzyme required for sulfatase activity